MATLTRTESLLAPADAVRGQLYRVFSPWFGRLYADRQRRVAVIGTASICVAFALTAAVPLWTLALAPLLLGVPHLVADVRYLVLRPGLHRRAFNLLAVIPLVAMGFGAPPTVGLLALGVAVLGSRAPALRKAAGLVGWLALTLAAWQYTWTFQLAFLHLHNLLALGLWWAVRPRGKGAFVLVASTVVGTLLLLSGAIDPVVSAFGGWSAPQTGTTFAAWMESNAPQGEAAFAARVVLSFAFLQSVHYVVWLRLIPEDARERVAPRSFGASWRALVQDFGLAPLLVCIAVAVGIAAWGALDLTTARWGYLRLAAFHGHLELAAAALLVLEPARTLNPAGSQRKSA